MLFTSFLVYKLLVPFSFSLCSSVLVLNARNICCAKLTKRVSSTSLPLAFVYLYLYHEAVTKIVIIIINYYKMHSLMHKRALGKIHVAHGFC